MWVGQVIAVVLMGIVSTKTDREVKAPIDAQLSSTSDAVLRVAQYRGKPVILFYEDKDSGELNRKLKDELIHRARKRGLLDAAHVLPVANVAKFDWLPAKQFALAAIRSEEKKAGVPILIDWRGTLSKALWSLPSKSSSVLVLDAEGNIRFQESGRLGDDDIERLFALVETLVVAPSPEGHDAHAG